MIRSRSCGLFLLLLLHSVPVLGWDDLEAHPHLAEATLKRLDADASLEFVASPVGGILGRVDRILSAEGPVARLPTSEGRLVRRVGPLSPPPLAVLPGARRENPSVLVADGVEVREIGLPIPSPIPVLEALKGRLAASDTASWLRTRSARPLRRRLASPGAPETRRT